MEKETRAYSQGSVSSKCQNCRNDFVVQEQDFTFYRHINVPLPTWCPECRAIRRLSFWNEHKLYRKHEAIGNKEIFSTYPEEAPIKIYSHDYWWGDKWDPLRYGRDYDFSRPFFAQYKELIDEMPWSALAVRGLVNSDYCNDCSYLKNCYLCFNCEESEDCLYSIGFTKSKNSMDMYWTGSAELCYETCFSGPIYKTFFSVHCIDCRDVWFSRDCEDCNNCFGCIGLRHKKYHIWNKPYNKEEYNRRISELNLGSYAALERARKQAHALWRTFPRKYYTGTHNTDVVGEYVWNSRNVRYVFQGSRMDNVRYSQNLGFDIKDSYDYTNWGQVSELIYEAVGVGDACRNLKFCFDCWPACEDLEYCIGCHSSTNLFGCFGLRKKNYCILNKEYSEKDFFSLREKIIAHMNERPYVSKHQIPSTKPQTREIMYRYGEFFPIEFSPLSYNESMAMDYFPQTRAVAEKKGYSWRDVKTREYKITITPEDLPDHIRDAKDSITEGVLGCVSCTHAYRILPRELEFYRRFTIPLPRLCFDCRHAERLKFRNPLRWWKRTCQCAGRKSEDGVYKNEDGGHRAHGPAEHCPNEFETSYAPDSPEIVYCEQCYNAEVV